MPVRTAPPVARNSTLVTSPGRLVDVDRAGNVRPICGRAATFGGIAPIIWKQAPEGLRRAQWNASAISSCVSPELRPGATT